MTDQRRPGKYPDELRERAVRMVVEATPAHGSEWEAICSVADKLGPTAQTVRKWVRRTEIDTGQRPASPPPVRRWSHEREHGEPRVQRANGCGSCRRGGSAYCGPVPRFRKRPLEIDAIRCASVDDASAVVEFVAQGELVIEGDRILISTLEGPLAATLGDWVVRGVQGECYPVKPDIFATTYEPVERPRHCR